MCLDSICLQLACLVKTMRCYNKKVLYVYKCSHKVYSLHTSACKKKPLRIYVPARVLLIVSLVCKALHIYKRND